MATPRIDIKGTTHSIECVTPSGGKHTLTFEDTAIDITTSIPSDLGGGGGGGIPNHNDTTNKQGGVAGQYYHITASQHTLLTSYTTVGGNLLSLTNPSAIRFLRINADNTVSALSDSDFRTAIGAGTGGGGSFSSEVTTSIAESGLTYLEYTGDYTYGCKFLNRSKYAGTVTGARVYGTSGVTYAIKLYSTAGVVLGTKNHTFSSTGFETVTFDTPIAIAAYTAYWITRYNNNSRWQAGTDESKHGPTPYYLNPFIYVIYSYGNVAGDNMPTGSLLNTFSAGVEPIISLTFS